MSTELIKVEEFTSLIKSARDALVRIRIPSWPAIQQVRGYLDTIEGEGMNDAHLTKKRLEEYLKKVSITVKNMQARRSPITQIFDRIRSVFTADEKSY